MSTSYLSMASGARISNYLGLKMDEGIAFRYPGIQERQYAYVEIPVARMELATNGEVVDKALRNQMIRIVPACSVEVRGAARFEVHPNRAFWDFGTVQGMYYLESKEGRLVPSFHIQLRKDLELTGDDYAIRIYMRE